MWDRVLLGLDQYESGQAALRFTRELAVATQSDVRVLHIRALSKWARVPPLETPAEAEDLVNEAVLNLRVAGLGAEGRSRSLPEDQIALRIVEESLYWLCDAIVLGTRRLHGIDRLSGRGVRDRVVRLSPLPVLAAPTPLTNGIHRPLRFGADWLGQADARGTRSDDNS
jgi:nucleotide-binding universal stress UspA family protein